MSSASDEPSAAVDAIVEPFARVFAKLVFWPISLFGVDVPIVVLFLFVASLAFTVYLRFPIVRGLPQALRLVCGREKGHGGDGEVSHFQALATALSGTVGVGNIANVAVAISIGGPGVTFWMILAGLLGSASKLVECTLGVKYRTRHDDGSVSGGPMYYLRRGLAARGLPITGKTLGGLYAVGLLFGCMGSGNMFQSNQAFAQFVQVTGGAQASWFANKGWLFGVVLAAAVAMVILGGIKGIARVTSKLVPFMAVLYVGLALVVIAMNVDAIPYAVGAIVAGAFKPMGIAGGAIGVAIMGVQRAVFSNEAGVGSAAIAHSAVRTPDPASEGLVALLEPLIDTVIICTITAMVVITTSRDHPEILGSFGGIEITSAAFAKRIAFAPFIVAVAAILFAFSTIISWAYYGLKGWSYVFGHGVVSVYLFKALYCAAVALGCTINLKNVLLLSDAMMFFICAPNLIGLLILAPVVKKELDGYLLKRASRNVDVLAPCRTQPRGSDASPT